MMDSNWKTWALIVILTVGIVFEVIKHLPGSNTPLWDAENNPFIALTKPYSVKANARPRPRAAAAMRPKVTSADSTVLRGQLEQFIAANKPAQTDFEHSAEKGAEGKVKKKKKKDADGWEEYIDPVTGHKMRRRKKKQIAKEDPKKDTVKSAEKPPEHPDKDIQAAIDDAITSGGFAPLPVKPDDVFADLQEWERRLLTHPDLKATQLFIQQYQQGLVSADIFYKIVQMMVADSRTEMKQMGVLCAGTNISYLSFQILAGVAKKERIGTPLRNSVDEALNHYSSLANLQILKKILAANSDPFTTLTALQRLDRSVQTNLIQAPPVNGQPAALTAATAANVSKYQDFLGVLQGLLTARDVAVNDEARITIADLQVRLGTTPPGTSPTPSVPAATTTAGGIDPTTGAGGPIPPSNPNPRIAGP